MLRFCPFLHFFSPLNKVTSQSDLRHFDEYPEETEEPEDETSGWDESF